MSDVSSCGVRFQYRSNAFLGVCINIYSTIEECRFRGKELRENGRHFIALTVPLRPRHPHDYYARLSNLYKPKNYTPQYKVLTKFLGERVKVLGSNWESSDDNK